MEADADSGLGIFKMLITSLNERAVQSESDIRCPTRKQNTDDKE